MALRRKDWFPPESHGEKPPIAQQLTGLKPLQSSLPTSPFRHCNRLAACWPTGLSQRLSALLPAFWLSRQVSLPLAPSHFSLPPPYSSPQMHEKASTTRKRGCEDGVRRGSLQGAGSAVGAMSCPSHQEAFPHPESHSQASV